MGDEILNASRTADTRLENRLQQLETRLERVNQIKGRRRGEQRHKTQKQQQRSRTVDGANRFNRNIYRLLPNRYVRNDPLHNEANDAQRADGSADEPFIKRPLNCQNWLLAQMQTNRYFWSTPQPQVGLSAVRGRRWTNVDNESNRQDGDNWKFLPLNEPISSIGVLLDSDVPAMDERLNKIRHSLNNFKNFSLDLSSADYHRFVSKQNNTRIVSVEDGANGSCNGNVSFTEIRARILNMEFHIERRIRDILDRRDKPQIFNKSSHVYNVDKSNISPQCNMTFSKKPACPNIVKSYNMVAESGNEPQNSKNITGVTPLTESINALQNLALTESNNNENRLANESLAPRRLVINENVLEDERNDLLKSDVMNQNNVEKQSQFIENLTVPAKKTITTNVNTNLESETSGAVNENTISNPRVVQSPGTTTKSDNYNRILEMLRGPQFVISSSSEDENEAKKPAINLSNMTAARQTNVTTATPSATIQAFIATNSPIIRPSTAAPKPPMVANASANDSDSDFFN